MLHGCSANVKPAEPRRCDLLADGNKGRLAPPATGAARCRMLAPFDICCVAIACSVSGGRTDFGGSFARSLVALRLRMATTVNGIGRSEQPRRDLARPVRPGKVWPRARAGSEASRGSRVWHRGRRSRSSVSRPPQPLLAHRRDLVVERGEVTLPGAIVRRRFRQVAHDRLALPQRRERIVAVMQFAIYGGQL